ncbi:hypothetical protein [Cognaticolwellia mytili]|uniref:hypothetical protein n=1 Tax=Cognaticolwellia mytili TaxID=1888913 RepID=UPI000A1715C4|nr:hypothetical protein [Cognaticolwellia mytili]
MRIYALLTTLFFYLTISSARAEIANDNERTYSSELSNLLEQYFLIFPPYWEKLADNKFTGLHYRLAKKLYQHAKLNVKFVNVPYQRMQFQISQGETAFINYGEVKGVEAKDVFHICVPPTKITLRVYYIKDDLEKVTTIEEFSDKNLIILHGLPLGDYESIKSNKSISFMRPMTIESAINGLKIGRGDYFIVFDNFMINAQQRFFSNGNQQLKNYPLFTLLGYPIVTPKTFKGGEKICAKVLSSYRQLIKEGIIDKKYKILASDLNNLSPGS